MIEAKSTIKLINSLKKVPEKIYIDCPDINIERYKNTIYAYLDYDVELIVKHKADVIYPVVSLASVIAKVLRDRDVEKIGKELKYDIGSGYPGDPKTKQFLKKMVEKNQINKYIRKSWQTYDNLLNAKHQQKLK